MYNTLSTTKSREAKYMNRHVIKEDIVNEKHVKGCHHHSFKEVKIKTTVRYHSTSTRIAIKIKTSRNKCWLRHREIGTLTRGSQACKIVQLICKTFWQHLKMSNRWDDSGSRL
jgi:hypothetical protein